MIAALSRFLEKSTQARVLSGAALAGVLTVAVKGVAFLKELFVAYRFGTSDDVDAFLLALMVPSLIAVVLSEALRDGLIPVYTQERRNNPAGADALVSNTVWICVFALAAVSLVGWLLAYPLIGLLGGGFSEAKQARSAGFFRLLLPYAVLFGVASLLKGYLQVHRRFFVSSLAPGLLPIGTIALLAFLPGEPNGQWLAWGTMLGSAAMCACLYGYAQAAHGSRLLRSPAWNAATRSAIRNSLPLLAGAAVMEGYYFIDTMMAAFLPAGSVAVLSYGERVCGVFTVAGIAAVQALFPHVTELAARRDWRRFSKTLRAYIGLVLILCAPLVFALWLGAEPLISLVFERGEFTSADTHQVSTVVRFASLQIPAFVLMALASKAVMALGANRFVLLAALLGLGLNVGLNLILMWTFGVPGIALSTAIANTVIALFLFLLAGLQVRKLNQPSPA